MAAVNHIRNRRNQRMRDALEAFIARSLKGEDTVELDNLLEVFENSGNSLDEKEHSKLKALSNSDNKISK